MKRNFILALAAISEMIKIEESYQLFFDTLSRLHINKLGLTDQKLHIEIFDELDSEYHTFLHKLTVDRLIKRKLIPIHLRQRILDLREKIRPVINEKNNISAYRNDLEWKKIREEANGILIELEDTNNN